MTEREQLLARVLGGPISPISPHRVVVLSAHQEPPEEYAERRAWAMERFPTAMLALPWGKHTLEEARQMAHDRCGPFVLVTSSYHQLRAFLTFVRVFRDEPLPIWNAPCPGPMDKLAEEFGKITRYQALGHVASYAEGLAYLDQQEMACDIL